MLKDKIGKNAGIIWHILDNNKRLDYVELYLLTKLNEADFNMAMGWLFREDNISIYEDEGKQIVFLVY
jgi:hypothetical protein